MAHDEALPVAPVLHAVARLQAGPGARQHLPDHLARGNLAVPAPHHAGIGGRREGRLGLGMQNAVGSGPQGDRRRAGDPDRDPAPVAALEQEPLLVGRGGRQHVPAELAALMLGDELPLPAGSPRSTSCACRTTAL